MRQSQLRPPWGSVAWIRNRGPPSSGVGPRWSRHPQGWGRTEVVPLPPTDLPWGNGLSLRTVPNGNRWYGSAKACRSRPGPVGRVRSPSQSGGCSGPGRTTGVIQVLASVAEQSQVTPARPPRPVLCRSAAGPWVHPEYPERGVRSVAGRQGQTPLTGSSTKSFNCPDLCVPGGFRTPTHYEIKNSMGHAKTPSVGTFRMPGGTDVSFPPGVGRIRGCVQQ